MTTQSIASYTLFGGKIRNLSVNLGINQNSTVATVSVVKDQQAVSVSNRQPVDISVGSFGMRGIVQSWTESKVDVAGTGIYQVRITDTKPVLDAAQVVIGSPLNNEKTQAYNYGDNVIPIAFQTPTQIPNGIPFSVIKSAIESASIKYGNQSYTVKFNFTLPGRGTLVEYVLSGRTLSLLELISQISNDHGLNWYVTTSTANVISINAYGRTNVTNVTINQLAALHPNGVIKRHDGQENRGAVQKVVLVGGYKSYLHECRGSLWEQFWGFDEDGNKRADPVYSEAVMESVINDDFSEDEYTEEAIQKILSYANEYWGRKFIGLITPVTAVGSDGRSWVTPTSAAWHNSDEIPMDFDRDGQLKFQTDDGRWITFVTLPLPGTRFTEDGTTLFYQWHDDLFSNPNTYIDKDRNIAVKASLEIADGFAEMEFWLELFIVYLLNLSQFTSLQVSLLAFVTEHPEMSLVVRLDFTRFITSVASTITAIANKTLIYTDEVKNTLKQSFSDQYFLLTLSTPLRVKASQSAISTQTTPDSFIDTRLQEIDMAYLSLLDHRVTYGPWTNRQVAVGNTEVIMDSSITPWNFGYRGILDSVGTAMMDKVALAKIRTVADTALDAMTTELEAAGAPKVNLGDRLQTTGAITYIGVNFGINGLRTTYKSLQYTTELSRHLKQQQDLLDKLRRQAAEFNNTMQPVQENWNLDRAIAALKKELPEPFIGTGTGRGATATESLIGRISARSSTSEPKYSITPMAWVSDAFGELTLVRNPRVFGEYLSVVNMGEKQTAPGRLTVGTDVQVHEFGTASNGVTSYYISTAAPKPPSFSAAIVSCVSSSSPTYKVTPIVDTVQQINLLSSERLALNAVTNIGEPANFIGYLAVGTEVAIHWNENEDGSYTPFIEQQVNLFKPI